jgi:hypothetical protein
MQQVSSNSSLTDLDKIALAAFATNDDVTRVDIQRTADLHGEVDECALTGRFSRFSMPYERVEIEPALEVRSRKFVRTIQLPLARGAERAWFDLPEAALIAIEEPVTQDAPASWQWLIVGITACAIALPTLWVLCRALPSLLST